MTLTKNFSLGEFTCRCGCGVTVVDFRLVMALQRLRDDLKMPLRILSGYRCAAHNQRVGGVPSSEHVRGRAADVSGAPLDDILSLARRDTLINGIGHYLSKGFVHLDVREGPRKEWQG